MQGFRAVRTVFSELGEMFAFAFRKGFTAHRIGLGGGLRVRVQAVDYGALLGMKAEKLGRILGGGEKRMEGLRC